MQYIVWVLLLYLFPMATDYSFLRWSSDFATAKRNDDLKIADQNLIYNRAIQLLPDQHYCQISNTPNGIAFDGDLVVQIVDGCDTVLATITDKCAASEFVDMNGLQQIIFEVDNIGIDFYFKTVYFKLIKSDVSSGVVFWSNPVIISNERANEVARAAYRHSSDDLGINYSRAFKYQSIGLRMWVDRPGNPSEVTNYYQYTRERQASLKLQRKTSRVYNIEPLSTFVFDRLATLFAHDEIYIDGLSVTDKPIIGSTERLGNTNMIKIDQIEAYVDLNNIFIDGLQVIEPLTAISTTPIGVYTATTLPNSINVVFNKNITLAVGNVTVKDSLGAVVATYTQADAILTGNSFDIADFGSLSLANGQYSIEVSAGFILGYGAFVWEFEISEGNYDSTYYSSGNYFTN